jgi:hypothetical protein
MTLYLAWKLSANFHSRYTLAKCLEAWDIWICFSLHKDLDKQVAIKFIIKDKISANLLKSDIAKDLRGPMHH